MDILLRVPDDVEAPSLCGRSLAPCPGVYRCGFYRARLLTSAEVRPAPARFPDAVGDGCIPQGERGLPALLCGRSRPGTSRHFASSLDGQSHLRYSDRQGSRGSHRLQGATRLISISQEHWLRPNPRSAVAGASRDGASPTLGNDQGGLGYRDRTPLRFDGVRRGCRRLRDQASWRVSFPMQCEHSASDSEGRARSPAFPGSPCNRGLQLP